MTIRHQQISARLIARYGGNATLQVPGGFTGPEYDPTPLPPTNHTVQMLETGAEHDLVDGSAIRATDFVAAMLPHASVTPTTAMRLIVGGVSMVIVSVKPVRTVPDGAVLHFVIQARA